MLSRHMCNTVLTFRSAYLQPHMTCLSKVSDVGAWQKCKFHVASPFFSSSRKKLEPKKKNITKLNNKSISVWENMTALELAEAMNIKFRDLKNCCPSLDLLPNTRIKSLSLFTSLAHKLGWKFNLVKQVKEEKKSFVFKQDPSKPENLVKRPPVVTVMGHVDHGKTTLLDSLRNSFVTQQEFGGITQHIGAFSVEVKPGEKITFIDTPGHAAFTAMRARGAGVTDIIVLVIAADDGVMQQTVESIRIAKAAKVNVIVAVNKIDKPTALSIDEIKEKLTAEGIQVEDHGGDTQLVPISALKKINLDLLTEVILLEAELMNLRGDPTGFVEGVIIESKMEKAGIVATVIVKRGTLKKGKILVTDLAFAKVRRMLDENGNDFKEVLPSTPVQIFGWREFPVAGDEVFEVTSEKQATAYIVERRNNSLKEKQKIDQEIIQKKLSKHQEEHHEKKKMFQSILDLRERRKVFFEQRILNHKKENEEEDLIPHLNIVLKGDVYGSLEVLEDILGSYDKHDECKLNIIEASVGDVKEKDLEIAEIANAIIYAFNVNLHETVTDYVKNKNIDIRYYNVIYKLIDDLKEELSLRIPDKDEEKVNGEAEVLENFMVTYASKKTPVAGSRCLQGQLKKEGLFKVLRNGEVIYEGKLTEMRHEKNSVKTISKGMECGLMLNSFPEKFIRGDRIICFDKIKVARKTSWNPGF